MLYRLTFMVQIIYGTHQAGCTRRAWLPAGAATEAQCLHFCYRHRTARALSNRHWLPKTLLNCRQKSRAAKQCRQSKERVIVGSCLARESMWLRARAPPLEARLMAVHGLSFETALTNTPSIAEPRRAQPGFVFRIAFHLTVQLAALLPVLPGSLQRICVNRRAELLALRGRSPEAAPDRASVWLANP
jgi:hypothetical protein